MLIVADNSGLQAKAESNSSGYEGLLRFFIQDFKPLTMKRESRWEYFSKECREILNLFICFQMLQFMVKNIFHL